MITLNCPNCGGFLELPNNIGVAHCIYCGTKILIEQNEATRELLNLKRFIELCKVAIEAKNHIETIQYCNKILEIDPNNVDAWVDKATASFWLTTGANNRYDEAIGYLNKASKLAPEDERIPRIKDELTHLQANWYNSLGVDTFKNAMDIWNIYDDGSDEGKAQAARNSVDELNEAIDYYLLALSYTPENITILENIEHATRVTGKWISWGEPVQRKLKSLAYLRAKKQAEENLPRLRMDLQNAERHLAKLKTEKGYFSSLKIKEVEGRITTLKSMVAQNERVAAYKEDQ